MTPRAVTAPKYKEGDLFAVPLPDGGYAIGIVARAARKRNKGILLGYFFGSRRSEIPSIHELTTLTPKDAVYVCRLGDLGLFNGTWSVIGQLPGWNKTACRSESDACEEVETNPSAMAECPEDGLMGAQAVALVLNSKLPKVH